MSLFHRNPEKVTKIVTTLNLKIAPRDLKSKDGRHLLSTIFSQWLSLSTCTIQAVIDVVPAPSTAQRSRIPKMLYPDLHQESVEPKNQLETDLWQCDASGDACVVAYVSKMFAVPTKDLPEKKPKVLIAEEMRKRGREAREAREAASQAEEVGCISIPGSNPKDNASTSINDVGGNEEEQVEETLLGFARLYSGTIHVNSQVFCVLPKYNNSHLPTHSRNTRYVIPAQIRGLYTMMGRELVPVEKVTAGNVFAISGLEGKVWRNATICAPNGKQGDLPLTDSCSEFLLNLGGVNRQVNYFMPSSVFKPLMKLFSRLLLSRWLWNLLHQVRTIFTWGVRRLWFWYSGYA
jgi:ribosome assembly protein 1